MAARFVFVEDVDHVAVLLTVLVLVQIVDDDLRCMEQHVVLNLLTRELRSLLHVLADSAGIRVITCEPGYRYFVFLTQFVRAELDLVDRIYDDVHLALRDSQEVALCDSIFLGHVPVGSSGYAFVEVRLNVYERRRSLDVRTVDVSLTTGILIDCTARKSHCTKCYNENLFHKAF